MDNSFSDCSSVSAHRTPLLIRTLILLVYMAAGGLLIGMTGAFFTGEGPFVVEADRSRPGHSVSCTDEENAAGSSPAVSSGDTRAIPAAPPAEVADIHADRTCPGSGEMLVLTALDAQGGTVWSHTAECGSRISANGSYYDTLEWMQSGSIVYINNASAEQLLALDRRTGSELWKLNGSYGCPVVYDFGSDGTLYIGSANEFYGPSVVAVSADGQELWRVTGYSSTSGIAVHQDHVSVCFDDCGNFYAVDFDFSGNVI